LPNRKGLAQRRGKTGWLPEYETKTIYCLDIVTGKK
jgi:hypothetical protein